MPISTEKLRQATPEAVRVISKVLAGAGHRAWAVGGCVRDQLMAVAYPDREPKTDGDWDIATTATPDEVKGLFRRTIPTGIEHGTVTVMMQKVGYEVTTLRGEQGYSDGRHPDHVYFVDDLAEDLARRDFTVNAIAYDVLTDELHDPFRGIDDLRAGLLRAVGDPARRFAEDGLRALRCARFAATLGFEVEPQTAAAIRPSLDSYRKVSAERIREEWFKALRSQKPSRAFVIMRDHGLLEETAPELFRLASLTDPAFSTNVLSHSMATMDRTRGDAVRRLGALLHDVGLIEGRSDHGKRGAPLARDLAQRLRLSNADRERVVAIVRHHQLPAPEVSQDPAQLRRWVKDVGRERVDDVLAVQEANAASERVDAPERIHECAAFAGAVREVLAGDPPLSIKELRLTGKDLIRELGLTPGPALGRLLDELLELALDEPSLNTREQLLSRARELANHSTDESGP